MPHEGQQFSRSNKNVGFVKSRRAQDKKRENLPHKLNIRLGKCAGQRR